MKKFGVEKTPSQYLNTLEEVEKKLEKERQEKSENVGRKKAGRKPKESTTKIVSFSKTVPDVTFALDLNLKRMIKVMN
ncbi:hypothetical protein [Peribacillus simplex]|uniref:hypothetical protein n=1 Tax=Peribacillus simplex TaxID=1478 RepID=UPI003D285A2E